MRMRMRIRIMAKNLGQLASERWSIDWLTMLIPQLTISQLCYLSKATRCASIPKGHNLRRLPHGLKPRSLAHVPTLRRLIDAVGWRFSGL